jgi:hypothetical protein
MLKIIGQCDIKRIMTLPIKTITEVLDAKQSEFEKSS